MSIMDNLIFMGYECRERHGVTDYVYGYARFVHLPFNDTYQANYITDDEETTKDTIVVTSDEVIDLAYKYKDCYNLHVAELQKYSDLLMDEFNAFVVSQGFSHFFDHMDDEFDNRLNTRPHRISVVTQFLRNRGFKLSDYDRRYMTVKCIEYFHNLRKGE